MRNLKTFEVVTFGEALWDIPPSGPVPGGAPINVAYHLHKMGVDAAPITRIGNDKEGKELFRVFQEKGIHTGFFQTDAKEETSKTYAKANAAGEMTYEIVAPVAWDFIAWEEDINALVQQSKRFVFGSLAARNACSRKTLFQLLEVASSKVLDINLRPPHYNQQLIQDLLSRADLIKLNAEELVVITDFFSKANAEADRMQVLTEMFGISEVVLTRGALGAAYYNGRDLYQHPGYSVKVSDTIGCGDAFLAGFLARQMSGSDPEAALQYASALGAFVATRKGACPDYSIEDIYKLMEQDKNATVI